MFEVAMALFAFVFGAMVGSFLNVVIYRLPLDKSVVSPPSSCPACGARIRAWQNIPIVSYLMLGGKCSNCKVSISPRYPLVEASMGLLSLGAWLNFGPGVAFASAFVFLAGLLAMTFIDIDHKIIPDSISLGGIIAGFAFSFWIGVGWKDSLFGILLGGGSLLAVALGYWLLTRREGMGMGDVKLLAAIGAFLGWRAVLFTVFAASLSGSVAGIVVMRMKGADGKFEVPFGPFLALGAALYLFWGEAVIGWYYAYSGF